MSQTQPRPSFAPSNWPGWIAVALIWLLGKTPQRVALVLSRPLGSLMFHWMGRRRRIAQRNIERCFPELNAPERDVLLRGNFRALARAVFEIAWSWTASDRRMRSMSRVEGMEHAQAAMSDGRGILAVTAHLTCLEIGARLMSMAAGREKPTYGIYRPLGNPVLEWYQNRGRSKYTDSMISKRDLRTMVQVLRDGARVWYAPDQDFGPKHSVFVPFFGIRTATLLATHKLAQMTGCIVVPVLPFYDEAGKRYVIRFLPALEGFPGPDATADLARLSAIMESQIRRAPEQYWWIHRRFKTRPEGEAAFYQGV